VLLVCDARGSLQGLPLRMRAIGCKRKREFPRLFAASAPRRARTSSTGPEAQSRVRYLRQGVDADSEQLPQHMPIHADAKSPCSEGFRGGRMKNERRVLSERPSLSESGGGQPELGTLFLLRHAAMERVPPR